jgi:hypothetical protein
MNLDDLNEARRKSIAETIHTISPEQLRALGEQLFPSTDHPWREKLFTFLAENPDATFHHAVTDDRYHIVYCADREKGLWFLPGSGVGPLQEKGLKALKEIVARA